jgi:hypothetical protein
LDINQNPNSPSVNELNPSLIFPGAEMNLANHYGDYLRIVGGYFAEQYAQNFGTSNYLDYSQWTMSATRSDRAYSQLNSLCLANLETVRTMATQSEEWGTYLAATVLRAFTYQVLVDCYGEVPYTEALDINNLNPKYDDGQVVYDGILKELDDALSKVSPSDAVCTNFLFGTKTAAEWIQLANALKLKILMRMSNVEDVKSQLDALIAEGNFPTQDVAWSGFWVDESGKANPFYLEEFATYFGSTQVNVVANLALSQTMLSSEDARLGAMFSPNTNGNYTGAVSGTNFSTSKTYTASYWCRPIITYSTPVSLITVSEIEFFLAEYYARYGGGDAESHYQAAVEASFNTLGVSGADKVLAAYPWDNTNYQRVIGIQKWIALGGVNNFEAWCEMRRLKYPAFGTVSGSDIYNVGTDAYSPTLYEPGTLYTPILCNTDLGSNTLLQRFAYAISSSSHNSNAPATKLGNVPVFWAK